MLLAKGTVSAEELLLPPVLDNVANIDRRAKAAANRVEGQETPLLPLAPTAVVDFNVAKSAVFVLPGLRDKCN